MELDSDPLWMVFDKVVHLLNDLRSKKHIYVYQLQKMMPKRDRVALAYLYFIPKPHKVILGDVYYLCLYCIEFYFNRKEHH